MTTAELIKALEGLAPDKEVRVLVGLRSLPIKSAYLAMEPMTENGTVYLELEE